MIPQNLLDAMEAQSAEQDAQRTEAAQLMLGLYSVIEPHLHCQANYRKAIELLPQSCMRFNLRCDLDETPSLPVEGAPMPDTTIEAITTTSAKYSAIMRESNEATDARFILLEPYLTSIEACLEAVQYLPAGDRGRLRAIENKLEDALQTVG